MIAASLQVPDDLCLMQRFNDAYRLTAACVCSPSYWRLAEKIGRTLDGIHDPVPTLNDKLSVKMAQFFTRLPPAAIFERRNWLMHTNPALYQPVSEAWHDVTADTVRTTGGAFRTTDIAPPRFRFGDVHDTRYVPSPH